MLSEIEFENIIQMITLYTGIIPKNSHQESIRHYLENRLAEISVNNPDISISSFIKDNPTEIERLINAVTVNETYFFREENQFKLLKEKILPELRITANGPVNIWSAACSSGEEIYSLALLGESLFLPANYTASDINTSMLEKCKKGNYKKNSIRSVDGSFFHTLLPSSNSEGIISIPEEIKKKINIKKINLSKLSSPKIEIPLNQHLIFIRNVFIYFTMETRAKILKVLAEKCMANGAYLFVSTNEIASLDNSIIPPELNKCSDGNVYYFVKRCQND